MKQFFMALIAVVVLVMLFAVGYWFNLPGVHTFLGSANDALTEVFGALFVGVKILFFAGVVLGIAYVVVELRRHSQVKVIGAGRHGYQQAVIHNGQIVHLNQPGQAQLDPMQQLAMLKTVMQLQGQMSQLARRTVEEVPQKKPLELAPPQEGIPAIVRYADVVDEVPDEMSLLGIHPSSGALELTDWEKLKMLWIIGSSSTGKSNTVFGKALEARNHGAKLAVVDQHINKPDSLAKKLAPLQDAFIRPIAVSDAQVIATLQWFKREFQMRVDDTTGQRAEQKIVLIMDEMNRMVRSDNEELVKLIKEVVAIGGEESRGFGMYLWVISQKAAHLKWLRDSAITVIAHRLTRFEEALLACNDDRKAAKRLLNFPVGRSFIYGVDFDDLIELQQPLYDVPQIVEAGSSRGSSNEPELPTSEAIEQEDTRIIHFDRLQKRGSDTLEVGQSTEDIPAQKNSEEEARIHRVAKMMAEEKSVNWIIKEEWGIANPGGAYQAALIELRKVQKTIAHRAIAG